MIKKIVMYSLMVMLMGVSTQAMAEDVFVTAKGKKYHKEMCQLVKNKSKNAIDKVEAEKSGLEPCKKCFKADQIVKAEPIQK